MKLFIKYTFLLLTIFAMVFLIHCKTSHRSDQVEVEQIPKRDLEQIKSDGILRVVIDYNSTNYFVYKGKPMGFQYELLKQLAVDLNLDLKLVVSNDLEATFNGLLENRYDLIAKNLTITKERSQIVQFTKPITTSRQVLVQRKPDNYKQLTKKQIEEKLIREQLQLADKSVMVQKNTAYYSRLSHLSEEIGAPIFIEEDTIYGVERLVAMVANGEIDYTVCDELVAKVNGSYYPNIDVGTPISFSQKMAWAVRPQSHELVKEVNRWLKKTQKSRSFKLLYNKYFRANRAKVRMKSSYHSMRGSGLSEYDNLIKKLCSKYEWDWLLISSIIYQESRFQANAESWAGAIGLMQIMPETADFFQIAEFADPKPNIECGLQMLTWLDSRFKNEIEDDRERLNFVLASYNVGIGHVRDAQRLAQKYGKDSTVWHDHVADFLLQKSYSKYYKDPVVKWGYCRGQEPFNYVVDVTARYSDYKNLFSESYPVVRQ